VSERQGSLQLPELGRSLVAEGVGTFALVFAGAGAVMVDAKTGALGHVGVAITFGLVIMAMITRSATSPGRTSTRPSPSPSHSRATLPWARTVSYWAAQVTGAIVAAALLRASLGDIAHLGATLPSGSQGQSFVWELAMTFFLMFVIMAVGHRHARGRRGRGDRDRRHRRAGRAMFGGPISGASMNPARSIGPALVSGDLHALWLYIVAPIVGASPGALVYQVVRGEQTRPADVAVAERPEGEAA
jgi:glycerol uptake facilitator-like aquaporin